MVNSSLQVRFGRRRWLSDLHVLPTELSNAHKLLDRD